jgi:hypothetical protein
LLACQATILLIPRRSWSPSASQQKGDKKLCDGLEEEPAKCPNYNAANAIACTAVEQSDRRRSQQQS